MLYLDDHAMPDEDVCTQQYNTYGLKFRHFSYEIYRN